AEYLISVDAFF
ncbi:hypothetical protein TGPRC2_204040B, partial [Toxoplasma gondii TgCatPRC2]